MGRVWCRWMAVYVDCACMWMLVYACGRSWMYACGWLCNVDSCACMWMAVYVDTCRWGECGVGGWLCMWTVHACGCLCMHVDGRGCMHVDGCVMWIAVHACGWLCMWIHVDGESVV